MAAHAAAAGSVKIHAAKMLLTTPQRTHLGPRVAPAPIIEDVMVCVVEIGAFK